MTTDPLPHTDRPRGPCQGAVFRVLVAEADARVRRAMASHIQSAGHQVTVASDGLEAWMRLREEPFHVLVADVRMPGLGGLELLTRLRRDRPSTRVVLVSGSADTNLVVRALRGGAVNFIQKPFTRDEFLEQMFPAFHQCALEAETACLHGLVADLQKKEAIDQRMAALGRMLSGMAHEIHNPLTFVKGNVELLGRIVRELHMEPEGCTPGTEQVFAPERAKEILCLLSDLEHGIERIEAVVTQVRKFGSDVAAKTENQPLAGLMEAALRMALAEKPEGVEVSFTSPPRETQVSVIGTEMEGCLVNLLLNAFAAASEGGGHVVFRAEEFPFATGRFDGFVEVFVEDNGPGIPKEQIAKVLNPFFTTKSNGMGLGLSTAHAAAKRNGAHMEIRSQEGEGTTAIVRLRYHRQRADGEASSS